MKNLYIKPVLFVLSYYAIVFNVYAQQVIEENELYPDSLLHAQPQFFLNDNFLPPDIAPEVSSPNAAAMLNFTNNPIDMASGLLSLSVPIYTIELPGLSFPVSLSYYSGGVKVEEVSSDVGMGWSLQAGGAIIQQVKGKQDFDDSYLRPVSNYLMFNPNEYFMNYPDYWWTKSNLENCLDFEPDHFSYSLLGKSGKLLYDENGGLIPYPFEELLFTYNTARDADGNRYYFNAGDGASLHNLCSKPLAPNMCMENETTTNSWLLTSIVTKNHDTVEIEYETLNYSYISGINELKYELITKGQGCEIPSQYLYEICLNTTSVGTSRIKKISSSRGHVVEFIYQNTQRLDLPGTNALSEIRVSLQGEHIKTAKLTQGYITGANSSIPNHQAPLYTTRRLRLDKVVINDQETYEFSYNPGLPGRINFSQDFYGYFTGRQASTLLPTQVWPTPFSGNNRAVNPATCSIGLMNKVTYPTGGYSTFTYGTTLYGGAQIKKIMKYSNQGQVAASTSYEYLGTVGSRGLNETSFVQQKMSRQDHIDLGVQGIECDYVILTSSVSDIHAIWPRFFKNTRVEEVREGDQDAGKSIFHFSTFQDIENLPHQSILRADISAWSGLPTKTEHFKKEGSAFLKVSEEITHYRSHGEPVTSIAQFESSSKQKINKVVKVNMLEPEMEATWLTPFYPAKFEFVFYNYFSTVLKPVKKISRIFAPSGVEFHEVEKTYVYNEVNGFLEEEIIKDGNNDLLKNTYRYPYHFSDAIYNEMRTNRLLSTPIMVLTWRNELAIGGKMDSYKKLLRGGKWHYVLHERFEYATPNASAFVIPTTKPDANVSNWIKTVTDVDIDLYGNIIRFTERGLINAFRYDYNGLFPIFHSRNSTSNLVAFTSFESNDKGGWSYTSNPILRTDAAAGNYVYSLTGSNPISRSISAGSQPYIVDFWVKSTSGNRTLQVNGENIHVGTQWQFIQRTFHQNGLYSISGSGLLIDNVRAYPKSAQVTGYTYRPSEGLTSAETENGDVLRYGYDEMKRLKWVKNVFNETLQWYDYRFNVSTSF